MESKGLPKSGRIYLRALEEEHGATNGAEYPAAEMSTGIIQMGGSKCDCSFCKSLEPGNYRQVQLLYIASGLPEALIKNRTGRFGK